MLKIRETTECRREKPGTTVMAGTCGIRGRHGTHATFAITEIRGTSEHKMAAQTAPLGTCLALIDAPNLRAEKAYATLTGTGPRVASRLRVGTITGRPSETALRETGSPRATMAGFRETTLRRRPR